MAAATSPGFEVLESPEHGFVDKPPVWGPASGFVGHGGTIFAGFDVIDLFGCQWSLEAEVIATIAVCVVPEKGIRREA